MMARPKNDAVCISGVCISGAGFPTMLAKSRCCPGKNYFYSSGWTTGVEEICLSTGGTAGCCCWLAYYIFAGYDYELFWRKLWCNHGWRKLLWRGKSNVKVTTVSQGRTPSLICLKHYAAWGSGMPKLLWSKQGGGKQSQGPCSRRSTLTVVEISEVNLSVTASSSASWINIGSSQR